MANVTYMWECGEEACSFCLAMSGEHITEPSAPAHDFCECTVTATIRASGSGKGFTWEVVMDEGDPATMDWKADFTVHCDGSDEPVKESVAVINPTRFSRFSDFVAELGHVASMVAGDGCVFLCC